MSYNGLRTSKADGSYSREINKIEKQDLLILDDFGLRALDSINRNYFMEIIEDRHGKRTTIIASQLPVETWHQIIGEQTIVDVILDRLVHSAHRIDIKGESMGNKLRKNTKFKPQIESIFSTSFTPLTLTALSTHTVNYHKNFRSDFRPTFAKIRSI